MGTPQLLNDENNDSWVPSSDKDKLKFNIQKREQKTTDKEKTLSCSFCDHLFSEEML